MEEFEVLAQGLFTHDKIRVDYRPGFHIRWEPSAETFIENAWEAYIHESRDSIITTYNGNIFRLDRFDRTGSSLCLTLSDIDFRSCIGTGASDFAAAFPHAPQANPLSVSVALITIDNRIVLERRSRIDTWHRKYHVIAGFMERESDAQNGTPHPFDTMKREIHEELALILETPLYATGLVRTVTGSEICFYSRLSIPFNTLLEIKAKSKTDSEIETLETIENSPSSVASFLADHTNDFVPSGRSCLLLYGQTAYGKQWYDNIVKFP